MSKPSAYASTLAADVADQIREEIIRQDLNNGDLFMTDAQIAGRFGISRNIAREAVSRLRGLGILQSRRNKGLLVNQPDPVKLWRWTVPFLSRSTSGIATMAMFRYALELGAIGPAVICAKKKQIEQLGKLATMHEKFLTAKSHNNQEENDLDIRFHKLILEMTGNEMIIGVAGVLHDFFQLATEMDAGGWSAFNPSAVWQHQAIAAAFRQRDADQARVLMKQHLAGLLELGRPSRTL